MVVHRFRKAGVVGSIPILGSIFQPRLPLGGDAKIPIFKWKDVTLAVTVKSKHRTDVTSLRGTRGHHETLLAVAPLPPASHA